MNSNGVESCVHSFLYDNSIDGRARRICKKCGKKQVMGSIEKDKWFDSLFAVVFQHPIIGGANCQIRILSEWSKEEIKLPL